jgi:cobalt-zinc-cadmium efflux system membrane fusion protein
VSADPDRLARISSPAAGRVEKVSFREGDGVKKGAPLVVIRVPEIARVRASHLSALARAKTARADAVRQRALFAQGLAAEQEALNAETEADAFDIEARSTAQQLGALGAGVAGVQSITISAPIDGTVVSRDAVVGQPAAADQVLGTVANLGEVWFLARVFEKDLGQLKIGAAADVHLNAYAGEHFHGTVEYIGQQIDPVARTVTARVRLENTKGLLRLAPKTRRDMLGAAVASGWADSIVSSSNQTRPSARGSLATVMERRNRSFFARGSAGQAARTSRRSPAGIPPHPRPGL